MGLLPTGIETLGYCPECLSKTFDKNGGTTVCSDCGYTERELTHYITPKTLSLFVTEN